jgi:hypothetical protein
MKNIAPQTLRRKVTAEEQKNHEIYILKGKISNCIEQIEFYTEILNNPKANAETQRRMLFSIEGEELELHKINEQLKKLI